MNKRRIVLPIFLVFAAFSFFPLLLSRAGGSWIVQTAFFPLQSFFLHSSQSARSLVKPDKLQVENAKLHQDLAKMDLLKADNASLRDQFQTSNPQPQDLRPAQIVGMPSFVPGVTTPEQYIIHLGSSDGVKKGNVVVYKDNLIGIIGEVNSHFSQVILITNKKTSFTAKAADTGAIGIVRGQGQGEVIFDNVLLSDTLKENDSVVTAGSQDITGNGFIPGLIIGEITSIEKNPAALFQRASIKPLVDFSRLTMVFVVKGD